jgi:hypothetical protein
VWGGWGGGGAKSNNREKSGFLCLLLFHVCTVYTIFCPQSHKIVKEQTLHKLIKIISKIQFIWMAKWREEVTSVEVVFEHLNWKLPVNLFWKLQYGGSGSGGSIINCKRAVDNLMRHCENISLHHINQLARVGTSKHTPGANVCVSSEVWATVGENCVELCSSGCRPASVGQL